MLAEATFLPSLIVVVSVFGLLCCGQDKSSTSQSSGSDAPAALSPQEQQAKELLYNACIQTKSSHVDQVHYLCKQIDRNSQFYRAGCCDDAAKRYEQSKQLVHLEGPGRLQRSDAGRGPGRKTYRPSFID